MYTESRKVKYVKKAYKKQKKELFWRNLLLYRKLIKERLKKMKERRAEGKKKKVQWCVF